MHEPTRELLKRQDVKALDVPTEPRPTLNRDLIRIPITAVTATG